jgi:hypothetical protein
MRENAIRIQLTGLQQDFAPLNTPGFTLLSGMVPREGRLDAPPARTAKTAATDINAPVLVQNGRVALYRNAGVLYLATEDSVHDGMVTTALTVLDSATGDPITWSVAGVWRLTVINDSWFLCNGQQLLFSIPSNGGTVLAMSGVSFAANWNGRLVLGGLSGTWFSGTRWTEVLAGWRHNLPETEQASATQAFGKHWLFIGEPGGGALDAPFHAQLAAVGAFGTAGFDAMREVLAAALSTRRTSFTPMQMRGDLLCSGQIGANLHVYSTGGISVLAEGGETVLVNTDVLAVGMGPAEHLAMTAVGWLLHVTPNGVETMKFGRLFGAPWAANLIFDEVLGDWYITVQIGPVNAKVLVGYMLTRQGLGGPLPVAVGFARLSKRIYVVGVGPVGWPVEVETGAFDLNNRGWKHGTQVDIDAVGIATLTARTSSTLNGSRSNGPDSPFNAHGVAFQNISFVDGAVTIKGVIGANGYASIGRIDFRFQGEDMRFRRGTAPAAPGIVQDNG